MTECVETLDTFTDQQPPDFGGWSLCAQREHERLARFSKLRKKVKPPYNSLRKSKKRAASSGKITLEPREYDISAECGDRAGRQPGSGTALASLDRLLNEQDLMPASVLGQIIAVTGAIRVASPYHPEPALPEALKYMKNVAQDIRGPAQRARAARHQLRQLGHASPKRPVHFRFEPDLLFLSLNRELVDTWKGDPEVILKSAWGALPQGGHLALFLANGGPKLRLLFHGEKIGKTLHLPNGRVLLLRKLSDEITKLPTRRRGREPQLAEIALRRWLAKKRHQRTGNLLSELTDLGFSTKRLKSLERNRLAGRIGPAVVFGELIRALYPLLESRWRDFVGSRVKLKQPRKIRIKKEGRPGCFRIVYEFAPLDRLLLGMAHLALDPLIDPTLSEVTVGGRPRRSMLVMINDIQTASQEPGSAHFVVDIANCFDSIPHQLLENLLKSEFPEWASPIMGMLRGINARGVGQGSPLGPLLANLFLDRIVDRHIEGVTTRRWIDDCIIVGQERALEIARAQIHRLIEEAGLALSPKTPGDIKTGPIHALGLVIGRNHVTIEKEKQHELNEMADLARSRKEMEKVRDTLAYYSSVMDAASFETSLGMTLKETEERLAEIRTDINKGTGARAPEVWSGTPLPPESPRTPDQRTTCKDSREEHNSPMTASPLQSLEGDDAGMVMVEALIPANSLVGGTDPREDWTHHTAGHGEADGKGVDAHGTHVPTQSIPCIGAEATGANRRDEKQPSEGARLPIPLSLELDAKLNLKPGDSIALSAHARSPHAAAHILHQMLAPWQGTVAAAPRTAVCVPPMSYRFGPDDGGKRIYPDDYPEGFSGRLLFYTLEFEKEQWEFPQLTDGPPFNFARHTGAEEGSESLLVDCYAVRCLPYGAGSAEFDKLLGDISWGHYDFVAVDLTTPGDAGGRDPAILARDASRRLIAACAKCEKHHPDVGRPTLLVVLPPRAKWIDQSPAGVSDREFVEDHFTAWVHADRKTLIDQPRWNPSAAIRAPGSLIPVKVQHNYTFTASRDGQVFRCNASFLVFARDEEKLKGGIRVGEWDAIPRILDILNLRKKMPESLRKMTLAERRSHLANLWEGTRMILSKMIKAAELPQAGRTVIPWTEELASPKGLRTLQPSGTTAGTASRHWKIVDEQAVRIAHELGLNVIVGSGSGRKGGDAQNDLFVAEIKYTTTNSFKIDCYRDLDKITRIALKRHKLPLFVVQIEGSKKIVLLGERTQSDCSRRLSSLSIVPEKAVAPFTTMDEPTVLWRIISLPELLEDPKSVTLKIGSGR